MPVSTKSPGLSPDSSDMALTLYDAFLDLSHPAASLNANEPRIIIAPPPGKAMESARAVGQELSTEKGLAMVSRFCFPEFDDEAHSRDLAQKPGSPDSGASLNRYDVYLQEYYFSNYKNYGDRNHRSQMPPYCSTYGPSYHSFAMQLSSGDRVYGHVRRYFPHHLVAKSRVDVGRRALRAMVILTRANGGEKFYRALFKCLEALKSQNMAIAPPFRNCKKPEQKVLHFMHAEHTRLLKQYVEQKSNKDTVKGHSVKKIPIITLKKIEFNNPHYQIVDEYNFQLPPTLVTPIESTQISAAPILPLLRCLGVAHVLRLFSALLCERRIILVSQSPSRLSACANAAVSMLTQGAVHWPHLYIPVLPPGMKPYLAAPVPYLVGLIACHARALESIQGGIGQAVVLDLDSNDIQVHGVDNHEAFIPDLLRIRPEFEPGEWFRSIVEILKEDLINALKADRKVVGDVARSNNSGSSVKEGLFRKGLKLIKNFEKPKVSSQDNSGVTREFDETGEEGKEELYAFGEGVENDSTEEAVKVAFTYFFVHLLGDMKCYLRPPTSSKKLPTFDKTMFLDTRMKLGDRQGTAMYAMLKVFKDTQMFEQFVKERVKEVLSQIPVTSTAPLFQRVTNHLRYHRINFFGPEVKNMVRDLAQSIPSRYLYVHTSDIRNKAMALTSNSRNDHLAPMELSRLTMECKEGTFILSEVMSVVWERLRDSRGMQWKHGLYGLQMIKELILQGPMAAVIEATDGLNRIHKMCYYEYSMRPSASQQIRALAKSIYDLLINRVKLFSQRRVCASRRKDMIKPPPPLKRNPKLRITMKFRDAHAIAYPAGSTSMDLLSTKSLADVNPIASTTNTYTNDLLALNFPSEPVDAPAFLPNVPSNTKPTTEKNTSVIPAECEGKPSVGSSAVVPTSLPNNIQSSKSSSSITNQYSLAPTFSPGMQQQYQYSQPKPSSSQQSLQYNSNQAGQVGTFAHMPQQQHILQQKDQIQPDLQRIHSEPIASLSQQSTAAHRLTSDPTASLPQHDPRRQW